MAESRRVSTVKAADGFALLVRFDGEKRARRVDLGGLIARNRHFAPLLTDRSCFVKAKPVDWGNGIGWPVETELGRLDLSADTLLRIADEQRPMTGPDFAKWRKTNRLSLAEAATTLGISRRTVTEYEKRPRLPAVVAIACRTLARDQTVLAAHFAPARAAGRPRKATKQG